MKQYSILEAINLALHDAMQANNNVVLLGEDIATNGGVFRATKNLAAKFGDARVIDTPLAESLIAGLATGMSTYGLRPVAEFQFMGFIYPAFEQIICHIARMRYRTKGQVICPLVLRAPYTGGINAPEHHSESTEAIFAHIPGLRVVTPSSPQNAYDLLTLAIASNDPVLFLEPKRIYHSVCGELDTNNLSTQLDKCQILSTGSDLTIISWGAMLPRVQDAIAKINKFYNYSINLIDLISIKPIDMETILTEVSNTGRCLIVHEAAKTCGLAAEISANINENIWHSLLAPVIRITGFDTIMPLAKLEQNYIPSVDNIYNAICKLMEQ